MITGKWLGKWIGGDYDGKHNQGCGLPIICPEAATHIQNVVLRVSMTLNGETDRPGIVETRAMAYSEEGLDELCPIFWQNALRCELDILSYLLSITAINLTRWGTRNSYVLRTRAGSPDCCLRRGQISCPG